MVVNSSCFLVCQFKTMSSGDFPVSRVAKKHVVPQLSRACTLRRRGQVYRMLPLVTAHLEGIMTEAVPGEQLEMSTLLNNCNWAP